jgi:hypothetical protein
MSGGIRSGGHSEHRKGYYEEREVIPGDDREQSSNELFK